MAQNVNKLAIKNNTSKFASIANFVVHSNSNNNKKNMQKLEFMPHFDKEIYEFMIPEGSNSVNFFGKKIKFLLNCVFFDKI